MSPTLLTTALAYHRAGLVVLPNDPQAKYPKGVDGWEALTPTEEWVRSQVWRAIGIRDVEGLDFDNKGAPSAAELYDDWRSLVEKLSPGLPDRLLMESTPSGGFHLVWRCEVISGNQKLATRPPTEDERKVAPKLREVTLIETRGQGGQFQAAPSPGYKLIRGEWTALPRISPAERQILLDAARALSRRPRRTVEGSGGDRPGDRFNEEGADRVMGLLRAAGWRIAYEKGGATYLTRPGKDHGVSATLGYVAPGVLYVFSSSASPFEPDTAYSPFAVYSLLEHDGDYKAAAAALRALGFGAPKEKPAPTRDWKEPVPAEEIIPSAYIDPLDVNDLLAMERRPPLWYIPGFLREGFGMLVGQPNVGKTPLVIQGAIAIAQGGLFLNAVECRRARVLFLGTEYTRQELIPIVDESRLGRAIERGWLAFKTIDDDDLSPRTADEALGLLEHFIAQGFEVIIIDVMTGFLPTEGFKQSVYRGDYTEFRPYHRLGLHYNAAILGTWHASKREADPRLMYNGSTGMWAVPASRMSMYTDTEQRPRLFSMPRFCDKVDWQLAQERTLAGRRWVLANAAPDPVMSEQERTIYQFLKEHSSKAMPKTPATVSEMTGLNAGSVKTQLRRMFDKNLVQQSAGGGYFLEAVTGVTGVTSVAHVTSATEAVTTVTHLLPQEPASGRLETSGNKSNSVFGETSGNTEIFSNLPNEKTLRAAGYNWLGVERGWYGYTPGKDTIGPLEDREAVLAALWRHYTGEGL